MIKKSVLLTALAIAGFAVTSLAQTVPNYLPTNGLVGWWPFNGNATDESGNGNNGTVNGASLTSDRNSLSNSAYSFNGTSNYIEINLINALNTANVNGLTLSGWTNMSSLTNQPQSIIFMADNLNNGFNTGYDYTTTKLYGQAGNSGVPASFFISSANTVLSNSWYNVVMTCDFNSNNSKLYINGVLQSQSSSTLINPVLSKIFIGSAYNQVWYQNGKLDDIGIWNRALSQQEITGLYNGNVCFQTITVTDTLLINTNITGFNPVTYQNTIKIWPNPTNDHITIDNGNLANLTGHQIKISNALGQQVFQSAITQQQFYVNMSTWGGNGIYFVNLINAQGVTIETRKIVLQ